MRRRNRKWIVLGVGLALLQGCGSCVEGSSSSSSGKSAPPSPPATIGSAGEPLLGTEATEAQLYGPEGGSKIGQRYKIDKDAQ